MGIPSGPNANAASQTPPTGDQANAVLSGQFTATGQSQSASFYGAFNIALWGNAGPNGNWQGLVRLERSFDGGTTWIVCGIGGAGQQAIWGNNSQAYNQDVSVVASEPEKGVLYRLNCTAITSGVADPINYRMSTTSPAPSAWGIPPG